jgi:hypothetical protein
MPSYTGEMLQHYITRTSRHIELVQSAADMIVTALPHFKELSRTSAVHDKSKFLEPEFEPYIWLTWQYKCKDDKVECVLPVGMKDLINQATLHHIRNNPHHPEYWVKDFQNNLDPNNRDKAVAAVDATRMGDIALAEMVADWVAMGRERGNPARQWYDSVNSSRFIFSREQQVEIDGLLKIFERG